MRSRILLYVYSIPLSICTMSCASFDLVKLRADADISEVEKIPPLIVEIDSEMFKSYQVYIGEYNNYLRAGRAWKDMPIEKQVELNQHQKSKRFIDTVKLFEQIIETNICEESVNKSYGFAVCRILEMKHSVNKAWFVPSILTLTVINWFGFPIASQTTRITAEIEILNEGRQPIATYSASGKGTAYSALYWGYWGGKPHGGSPLSVKDHLNISRGSNARALLDALKLLKQQIIQDASEISKELMVFSQK